MAQNDEIAIINENENFKNDFANRRPSIIKSRKLHTCMYI